VSRAPVRGLSEIRNGTLFPPNRLLSQSVGLARNGSPSGPLIRASQVLSKWETRGGLRARCSGMMFTDVEHGHAGARKLDLGNATGTWGFDLVATSARAEL
jgi:hypothetical protein